MQEKLTPAGGRAIVAAVALGCGSAHGLTLGDLQVDSALGEPLEARILVTRAPGERIEGRCFSNLPAGIEGLPELDGARLTFHRSATSAELQVRTFRPVEEPALALRIRIACPGRESGSATRDYQILLEPRGVIAPTAAPLVTSLAARAGDTFESLARAMVPGAAARRQYVAALRAANPAHATLGDRDALPVDAAIAIPDPRGAKALAQSSRAPNPPPPRPAPPRAPAEPTLQPAPVASPPPASVEPKRARTPSPQPKAAAPRPAPSEAAKPAPREPTKATRRGGGDFVLKLSTAEIDLTPSARIDDRMRQQLRERQLLLDADDQVSALLAMRNSLRQLETRVAELQLKLSGMPPGGLPAPAPRPPQEAAPVAPAPATPAAAAPAVPAAAPIEPKPAPAPAPAEPPKPIVEAKPVEPPKPTPPATPSVPKVAKPVAADEGVLASTWAWAAGALLILVVGGLVLWRRRSRAGSSPGWDRESAAARPAGDFVEPVEDHHQRTVIMEAPPPAAPAAAPARAAPAIAMPEPPSAEDESRRLRRRYIEERFPEILNGTIELDDADSVIKGARLFYEDGAMPRAVELLQFAIDDRPGEIRPWLALFEIYRLERLGGQYGELAARFRAEHGETDEWRKVRYFGREIDPGNEIYREDVLAHLETIGPREARRIAAANEPVDPIAENWLNAPMDFENEVLANELRRTLMAEASLVDQDLVSNPMAALRKMEMFTVA